MKMHLLIQNVLILGLLMLPLLSSPAEAQFREAVRRTSKLIKRKNSPIFYINMLRKPLKSAKPPPSSSIINLPINFVSNAKPIDIIKGINKIQAHHSRPSSPINKIVPIIGQAVAEMAIDAAINSISHKAPANSPIKVLTQTPIKRRRPNSKVYNIPLKYVSNAKPSKVYFLGKNRYSNRGRFLFL